jgi:anti-sigma factor RsiW
MTTTAAVAAHLSMNPGDADVLAKLEATVAAVNALVPRLATTPPEARELGATMLAARLYRRRNSPEGVATFAAEGAVYVQRNDPDVALLLGIGSYAPPVVG